MLLKNDRIKRDLVSKNDLNIFVQKIEIKGNEHLESGPKWTVKGGDSGRSFKWVRSKVDGLGSKWTRGVKLDGPNH